LDKFIAWSIISDRRKIEEYGLQHKLSSSLIKNTIWWLFAPNSDIEIRIENANMVGLRLAPPVVHYLKMKFLVKILVLTLIASCSNNSKALERYSNYPEDFAKQKVTYPNNDFSLYIPKDWVWKVETYENENIILGIDAVSEPDKDGFINILSIQKIKSFGNSLELKSEFEYWLNLLGSKVTESGSTNLLDQKAYFIHTKSNTGTYGEAETISFLIESEEKGKFYILTASVSQTADLEKNMGILIQSLKTFEVL